MACNISGFPFAVADPSIEYYQLTAVVVLFIAFYTLVKYSAGIIFKRPEWEAGAKVGLGDIWLALLTLILAVAFFEGMKSASCTMVGNDPINSAMKFLQKIKAQGVLEAINDVYTIQVAFSTYNTLYFRPHEAVWTWIYKVAPGSDGVVGITNVLGYALAMVYSSLSAQVFILSIVDAIAYKFLLPAGILLRFLPPTKDAGTFLIVASIAFQTVLPMTYVLNEMALNDLWQITERGAEYIPYIGSTELGAWKWGFVGSAAIIGAGGTILSNVNNFLFGAVGLPKIGSFAGTAISTLTMESMAYSVTFLLMKPLLEAVGELSLVSLFLPAFSTVITFSFINAVTKFIISKA